MLGHIVTRRVVYPTTVILLIVLVVLNTFIVVPWYVYALVILAWFLITLCGSFFIRWDFHLKSLHCNKQVADNWVAITFDDGPDPEFTPQVLDLLKKYGAKATFFCVGHKMERHPELLKRTIAEGHTVGNHTYSHSRAFGFYNTEEVKSELERAKAIVKDLTGLTMDMYRPTFGVTNPSIEKAVKDLDLQSIGWNVRSLDTTARTENMVLKRITSKVSKGDIILLHDTSAKSVAVLERLLVFLQEKNLQSVTADQLLGINAYA
ncbi:polysaccharide deacetylase family protein [Pseudozobellia thermophila]|uniref:Peptidoglycan/xylan/chitin deacetylase, PgdA/CDA1 family n=1 Tax=Pseudozobellia thermophila TaxID=192903 RepID=A0A1M6CK98_9FLAO|nr:polysaccharide deacetylase family protein [Pseudozobellia thermophila]SHI61427.1 Peptidoglycan/xylan/chitin deacetylase, PgdA/CDA1 family [Pseudozobellia thermophila]